MSDSEIPPQQPHRGQTGPTTPDGKARSSENAITHGCRSAKLILRHENPAEFEALRDAWFTHYQPETEIAIALVEETVRAHWMLKRAQKNLENIEWELPMNAYHWTETHERLYRNFTRYKNSYERTFLRFFKELEAHLKRNTPAAEMKQRALAMAALFQAQSAAQEEPAHTVPQDHAPDDRPVPRRPDLDLSGAGPRPAPGAPPGS